MVKVKFPLSVLKPIKEHLKKEEKKLKKRKKKLQKEDPFQDPERLNDNAVDSDAAEKAGHERVAALKKEIDNALIEVRKTLTKIKVGNYGLCEECGHMIDTGRLSAKPTADLCMKCLKKERAKTK
jgi:DnaK suppressor protein